MKAAGLSYELLWNFAIILTLVSFMLLLPKHYFPNLLVVFNLRWGMIKVAKDNFSFESLYHKCIYIDIDRINQKCF